MSLIFNIEAGEKRTRKGTREQRSRVEEEQTSPPISSAPGAPGAPPHFSPLIPHLLVSPSLHLGSESVRSCSGSEAKEKATPHASLK